MDNKIKGIEQKLKESERLKKEAYHEAYQWLKNKVKNSPEEKIEFYDHKEHKNLYFYVPSNEYHMDVKVREVLMESDILFVKGYEYFEYEYEKDVKKALISFPDDTSYLIVKEIIEHNL